MTTTLIFALVLYSLQTTGLILYLLLTREQRILPTQEAWYATIDTQELPVLPRIDVLKEQKTGDLARLWHKEHADERFLL